MPVLDVEKCKSVLFVKRSLSPGYAGIDNDLFYKEYTYVICGCKKNDRGYYKKFIKIYEYKIFL